MPVASTMMASKHTSLRAEALKVTILNPPNVTLVFDCCRLRTFSMGQNAQSFKQQHYIQPKDGESNE
jgi:hypothetical protein